MKLRNIEFGNVLGASGVQGFFGEGYWFHPLFRPFGLDFTNTTFVAKTATLDGIEGNMPLTEHYAPHELFPKCIKARPLRGAMLNAVGLSNPGLGALLGTEKWQKRTEPFFISLMSLADTPRGRKEELRTLVDMIGYCMDNFSAPFGLQINLSCPTTKHNPTELITESADMLEIAGTLGIPLMPKYSIASAPIEAILELNNHPHCDAICVSNTLPFGWKGIDWEHVWGSKVSPLEKLGGGGLSGAPLCSLVCEYIACLRNRGFTKPINGGGGILSRYDLLNYHAAGASSVFIGSVAILRPWRVRSIIEFANCLSWR